MATIVWYMDSDNYLCNQWGTVHITTKVLSSKSHSWQGALNATLCGKVCHRLATGRWLLYCHIVKLIIFSWKRQKLLYPNCP